MESSPDRSGKRWAFWAMCTAASIGVALAGVFWFWSNGELRKSQNAELRPMVALLQEDQQLLEALQSNAGALQSNAALETNSGILPSYIAMIRADGLPKHAEMKQQLDRLAENNSALVALIDVYAPHAKTAAFATEADKFRRYAIAWRDRWNSLMELYMAGGNYPVAGVPFPKDFVGAVRAEMEAVGGTF